MLLGTTLRQGRLLASKRPDVLIGSVSSTSSSGSWAAKPFSTTLLRCIQQQGRSSSAVASNVLATNLTTNTSWQRTASSSHYQPIQVPHHSYHTSAPAAKAADSTDAETTPTFPSALSPAIRATILADLHAVDFDNNGKIDAEELKVLLGKYNESFSESEILDLSELFYSSIGAGGVEINRFVEALDAAASGRGSSGIIMDATEGEVNPLVAQGKFKTHPLGIGTCASEYMFTKTHGGYTAADLNIEVTHVPPVTFSDKTALFAVKCVRVGFDTATLWNFGSVTKNKILYRAIFLETIAAIPGMVAAIIRHFRSLRNMARDGGMLNMFLEEANNERMHLLTFIRMKEPGTLFRAAVVGAQVGFGSFFITAYMLNPTWSHRFIGYIEEEACSTYTKILDEMDKAEPGSELDVWKNEDAPKIAKGYWRLGEHGTVYDVMQAVRADEAEHRDVNHSVSGVPDGTVNPLYDPRVKLDKMMKKYINDIMEKNSDKEVGSV